jgi:hypothetical protein
MPHLRQCPGFRLAGAPGCLDAPCFHGRYLEGDPGLASGVVGLEDGPERTPTEEPPHVVAAEGPE